MSVPPRQLALNLPAEPRYGREDFLVTPSNQAAFDLLEGWPDWPEASVLLIGPSGSGKSHLGAIWATRAGASVVAASALPSVNLPELVHAGPVLVEDADRAPQAEQCMFHLINMVRSSGGSLVATARARPDAWGLALADLLSRLRLATVVEIGAPDDALVRAVLVKLFHDRQLMVDASVVEYLVTRIERSLEAARAVVEALDREALERGRPVTRPMVADFLKRLEYSG